MSADPVNPEEKHRLSYLTVAQMFRLDIACQQIKRAFGGYPYLVGSVLTRPDFRDVDLRLLMCERRGSTDLVVEGRRLRFLNAAISEWIATTTGLPIDFQFQDEAEWDEYDSQTRHPRGLIGDE